MLHVCATYWAIGSYHSLSHFRPVSPKSLLVYLQGSWNLRSHDGHGAKPPGAHLTNMEQL